MRQTVTTLSRKATRHFSYLPFLAIAAAISFLKLLVYARWLNVEEFGELAKFFVLSSAIGFIGSAGFHMIAQRRVPALLEKEREGDALLEVLRANSAMVCVGVGLLLLLLPLIITKQLSDGWLWIFALAHGLLNHAFVIVTVESKSRLQMFRYSMSVLWRAVVAIGLGIAAARLWGAANAVLVGETVGTGVVLLFVAWSLLRHASADAKRYLKHQLWGKRAKWIPAAHDWQESFVLLLAMTVALVSMNLDRWFAAGDMSAREFGIYAFAWIVMTGAQSVQHIINAGFFPIVARAVAGRGASEGLKITAFGVFCVIAMATAFGVIVTVIAPKIIREHYPGYSDAMAVLPFFLIAATIRVSDFWTGFLIIMERESQLLKIEAFGIAITIALWTVWAWRFANSEMLFRYSVLALSLAVVSYAVSVFLSFRAVQKAR